MIANGAMLPSVTGILWPTAAFLYQRPSPEWSFGHESIHSYLTRLCGDRRIVYTERFDISAIATWRTAA
ncbi:hypothetical protein QNH14_03095 [Apirhabdus apintestini]|nr:hypothetical protein QNH14_03095 [Enterobacteriaceae bacterium CA-0114]